MLTDSDELVEMDRIEPTVFTVNTPLDGRDSTAQDGKCATSAPARCTLRAAIEQANETEGTDTIRFAPDLSDTIALDLGHLSVFNDPNVARDLIINGPKPKEGTRILTVSDNNASRVFRSVPSPTSRSTTSGSPTAG